MKDRNKSRTEQSKDQIANRGYRQRANIQQRVARVGREGSSLLNRLEVLILFKAEEYNIERGWCLFVCEYGTSPLCLW